MIKMFKGIWLRTTEPAAKMEPPEDNIRKVRLLLAVLVGRT